MREAEGAKRGCRLGETVRKWERRRARRPGEATRAQGPTHTSPPDQNKKERREGGARRPQARSLPSPKEGVGGGLRTTGVSFLF